jgi:DNA (cytosine-5)-methyltransferase 3A
MNKLLSNLVVLSLFDGISCGYLALKKAGMDPEYMASEIHLPSIRITQGNNPNIQQVGDVRHIDGYRLRGVVNLLIGGSPCQCFSMAGTRKGMTTKTEVEVLSLTDYLKLKSEGFEFEGESYLFWEFVRLLKEIQPKYFLLENVHMSDKWARIISDTLGVI